MATRIKCLLIGDGFVGKTSLISVFVNGRFSDNGVGYCPTIEDNQVVDTPVDNQPVKLHLWDTAGQEEYKHIRQSSYPGTDIFLLCYAVDDRNSFDNVNKWKREARQYCPKASIVLVATKTDQRSNPTIVEDMRSRNSSPVSRIEGENVTFRLDLAGYQETSARLGSGVQEVFTAAVRAHLKKVEGIEKRRQQRCGLL